MRREFIIYYQPEGIAIFIIIQDYTKNGINIQYTDGQRPETGFLQTVRQRYLFWITKFFNMSMLIGKKSSGW